MDPHDLTPLIGEGQTTDATTTEISYVYDNNESEQHDGQQQQRRRLRRRRGRVVFGAALCVAGVAAWRGGWSFSSARSSSSSSSSGSGNSPARGESVLIVDQKQKPSSSGGGGGGGGASSAYAMSAQRDGGYSPVHVHTRNMYGLSDRLVLEPGVHNIIELSGGAIDSADADSLKVSWEVTKVSSEDASDPVIELPDGQTAREINGGTSLRIAVEPPNSQVKVTATVRQDEWSDAAGAMKERVVATVEQTVLVRYVRREIRTLTEDDLERYFTALRKVMTTPQDVGKRLYGEHFTSLANLVALHNMNNMAYHGNLFFATSHPAMQLKMEKSLLAVDPASPTPYWDMLLDAPLGRRWTDSAVYQNNWFGPVKTTAADDFRVRGRFREVRSVYDPNGTQFPASWHNYFGFLGMSSLDNNKNPYYQRTNNFCGFSTTVGFSDCNHIENCFLEYEATKSLHSFDICLERYVHANLHEQHAGMWNCAEDWQDFLQENHEWLDEDLLSIMAFATNDFTRSLLQGKQLTCPMKLCDVAKDDHQSCSCKSSIPQLSEPGQVGGLSDEAVYALVQPFWDAIYEGSFKGALYMELNNDWGGQTPRNMTRGHVSLLNRLVLKTSLFPGTFGKMASGAAANDPLFWVMHQIFDKAFHALRLSPRYNGEFLEWDETDDQNGRGWTSTTPFKWHDFEPWLGENKLANPDERLTNKMLWSLLHPKGSSLPYVYDQMSTWGTCDFDPMGERG